MNKLFGSLIVSLFCLLVSAPAMAAEEETEIGLWFETGVAATSGDKLSWLTAYYDHDFSETLGVYALLEKESDGYHEFYAGPKLKLTEWLEVGVGVGREVTRETPNSARRNAWVAIETDKISAYATYENGAESGTGKWHKAYALYKFTDALSAGVMEESLYGEGVRAEYAVAKNVSVWAAQLRDRDTKESTTLFAVSFWF